MAETLEPCPFCGQPPDIFEPPNGGTRVVCGGVDCAVYVTALSPYRAEAIRLWNTRKQKEPTK